MLVFVPLAFIVGVYGQFFASLSWALSIAVLVSMVISLTLIPVFAAKFLAGRPMPEPGPIYRRWPGCYELVLASPCAFPWLTLTASVAAVGVGVLLYTGIPNWRAAEAGKPPRPPLVKGLKTGLMPAMDEGAFVVDYWAPSGTPLTETEEKAKVIEEILSENPDVEAYVRRTGAELGLFATATNRGDIQVVLRPAEDDPVSLLRKPVRPKFEEIEKEVKAQGKDMHTGRDYIRNKYRRRSMDEVREEIEDEIKEHFSEHQLKVETVPIIKDELNDLSGANKPVEVKLFGPDYHELHELAEEVGKVLKKLKEKNKSIQDIDDARFRRQSRSGGEDRRRESVALWRLTPDAIERQLNAIFFGQVATQVRESALRITDVRVRYPDSYRFGKDRFDPQRRAESVAAAPRGGDGVAGRIAVARPCCRAGRVWCRCQPWPGSNASARPTSNGARINGRCIT